MAQMYGLGTFVQSDGVPWPGIVSEGKVGRLRDIVVDAPATLFDVFTNWDVWRDRIDAAMGAADISGWADEQSVEAQLPFMPDNLFGVGANFRKHVIEMIVDAGAGGTEHLSVEERRAFGEAEMDRRAESGKPFAWVGLRSSIAGPDQPLVLPNDMTQPDWELELAIVIGRKARRVPAAEAFDYIAGYTIANDVTARELVTRPDLKNLGMDWMACKGAPGFKIIGPYITPSRFVADPQNVRINLSLNGKTMQDESTDDMIFGVARIVEFISAHSELRPGDVIMTGSPSGNGTHYNRYLRGGDEMVGRIDGLVGEQRTRCVAEPVG